MTFAAKRLEMRFFKMPLIHGNFSYASSVALQFWNVSGAFEFIYDVMEIKILHLRRGYYAFSITCGDAEMKPPFSIYALDQAHIKHLCIVSALISFLFS